MQQHALRQTHRPQKPQRSKRKVWKNFTLKLSLFRIWFFKNILVWVSTAAIICLICILTGNITAETPFLGKFIYPLFAPIIDEIVAIIEEDDISNIMDFFAVSGEKQA